MYQGYIKDYRQEIESDIWQMPPLYHRVWQYLKYKASYTESYIPLMSGDKFKLEKGQHLTSYRHIAQGIEYYEGKLKRTPNEKTIKKIIDWLIEQEMIIVEHGRGNREYTLVTIVKWEIYQSEIL